MRRASQIYLIHNDIHLSFIIKYILRFMFLGSNLDSDMNILILIIAVMAPLLLRVLNADADRLDRIRSVSRFLRMLVYLCILGELYSVPGFIFGWPWPGDTLRVVVAPGHVYSSFAEMPRDIFLLWMLKNALGVFSAATLSCLFRLYEKGILFSPRNVLYLRFLGYCVLIVWAVDYQIQNQLRDMNLSMNPILVSFMIIFLAWIIDEGRKIREEQELTV